MRSQDTHSQLTSPGAQRQPDSPPHRQSVWRQSAVITTQHTKRKKMNKCTCCLTMAGLTVLIATIIGVYELIKYLKGDTKEVATTVGISSKSEDLLEVDPRLNVSMSEATPLTIVLIIGGIVFFMITSVLAHRGVYKPWRARSQQRDSDQEAHKQSTITALERLTSRLDSIEEGWRDQRNSPNRNQSGQRMQEEQRQPHMNHFYNQGISFQGLQQALEEYARHSGFQGAPAPPPPTQALPPQGSQPQGPPQGHKEDERPFAERYPRRN